MDLAIFDLDNTLLQGDSEVLWWQFLADKGFVKADDFALQRQAILAKGDDNIDPIAYTQVSVTPLANFSLDALSQLRDEYIEQIIQPRLLPQGKELVARHQQQDDMLLIITATNRFIAAPIVPLLPVDNLIATELEKTDSGYTGKVIGTPSFREGKVTRLQTWLSEQGVSFDETYFYSDSHHDLPLLERVTFPIAVDPTNELREIADAKAWPIISLRD
jgi:HAD superfamily hydrolase (TIGR01490 family)